MKHSSGVGRAIVTLTLTDIMQKQRFLHSISLHIVLDTNQNVEHFWVLFLHD